MSPASFAGAGLASNARGGGPPLPELPLCPGRWRRLRRIATRLKSASAVSGRSTHTQGGAHACRVPGSLLRAIRPGLDAVQLGVEPALRDQRVVAADLGNARAVQHDD